MNRACKGGLPVRIAALLLMAGLWPLQGFGHAVHEPPGPAVVDTQDVRSLLAAFRRTGDDHYLERAWSRVEPRLGGEARTVDLLVDAAAVAQARHRFELARELLHEALAKRADNDQAWLLLAAVELVRGAPDAAAQACTQLRRTALVVGLACQARVVAATGDAALARARLDRVLGVTGPAMLEPETLAWVLSVAGDLAVTDRDPGAAIVRYRESLALAERTQVRAALADVLIAAGRFDEAADVLAAGSDALPLMVRRLIVARELGRSQSVAAEVRAADHRFRHWIEAKDWLHAREMARFYLDVLPRPALARQLADINLRLQKEPEDRRLWQRSRPSGFPAEPVTD